MSVEKGMGTGKEWGKEMKAGGGDIVERKTLLYLAE